MRAPTNVEKKSLVEYSKRSNLAIRIFRPLEHQEDFFRLYAREFLLRGGNRSGKSVCAGAKFASIAMDIPITLADGTVVHQRQPHQRGRTLRMWVVAIQGNHIGQTIHRILFKKGLFDVIRDENTGKYRAFRKWDEKDRAREAEKKPSPPLIPATYIDPDSWSWEDKRGKVFESVSIINPQTKEVTAEIYAYSSKSEPKAGDPVDCIWIDEAIADPEDYPEWQGRLIDNRGNMFWSSYPKVGNEALENLTERAKEEADKEEPLVRELVIKMSDNVTIDDKSRKESVAMFGEEQAKLRDEGEYATESLKMYPIFDEDIHCAEYEVNDELGEFLRSKLGMPPNDWTHELILDPGTNRPGVLFVAIPPPKFGQFYVPYDEVYPGRADAFQLAKKVSDKSRGRVFHRLIIDAKAATQKQMGYSVRVMDNYVEAFRKYNIRSVMTGHSFAFGSTDVGARIGKLNSLMHIQSNGYPKLRIANGRCPILVKQLKKYRKAFMNKEIYDDRPAKGQQIDLAVCLEYFAASYPEYVEPSPEQQNDENYKWYWENYGSKKKKQKPSFEIGASYKV